MKGKVRGEKEDLVPCGKNQKRQEQKKAKEIRIDESMEMILSYFFIFFSSSNVSKKEKLEMKAD